MKAGTQPVQGTVRKNAISLKLGFSGEDYGYAIDLGLPTLDSTTLFSTDPVIKAESLWTGERLGRSNAFALRNGPGVRIRDDNGEWRQAYTQLAPFDSMMTHCSDPREAIELLVLRERMRDWRFYDHMRTDPEAPARKPQVGTYTPVLAADGSDLAAAIQTIREIGAVKGMNDAIADAFPGSSVAIAGSGAYLQVQMRQHGLLRPLLASELSDGTLRYLLLVAALLSPRPPALMILNEPETSLHPDLLPSLARLIVQASKQCQMIVVSHAPTLVSALDASPDSRADRTGKDLGRDGSPGQHAAELDVAVAIAPCSPRAQCVVIQARASRCAVAISTSDIISATSRRMEIASVRPFRAARLNHLCAATRLTTPERPLAQ